MENEVPLDNPFFYAYLKALVRFVADPTQQRLDAVNHQRNLRSEKTWKAPVAEHGYCHPFGDYASENGVSCIDGSDMDAREEGEGRCCPMLSASTSLLRQECQLACGFSADVVLRVIETLAAYEARYPDWPRWKELKEEDHGTGETEGDQGTAGRAG